MADAKMLEQLLQRIESKTARCGILGLGYVGLPLAVEFARQGFDTVGFDVSEPVIAGINAGRSHIGDIEDAELAPLTEGGMLRATSDMALLGGCDVVSICVPTPLSKTRDPDVSYVVAATEAVAAMLRPGQVIILESTTYPGTTRELMLPMLQSGDLRVGEDFFLCFSPERVDPGNPQWHIRNTPKVIGGITEACGRAGAAIYAQVMERLVEVSSTESAELAKLLENTFRAVNIALVNEMAQVADLLDVDVFEVIEAAASKPFGYQRFEPGPGIGGHCIPLDPQYLAWKMRTLNYKTRLIDLAGELNSEMPRYVVNKVQDALNDRRKALNSSRILILGVAYKRDVDDIRESPALDVIRLLAAKGAEVDYHDPHVAVIREDDEVRRSVPFTGESLKRYDCVVITTDHRNVDYGLLESIDAPVVDTRNAMRGRRGTNVIGLSGSSRRSGPAQSGS